MPRPTAARSRLVGVAGPERRSLNRRGSRATPRAGLKTGPPPTARQHPRPNAAFKIPGKTLMAGEVPRVVGVLSSIPETIPASGFPSDLVEIRLDALSLQSDWLECGRAIQARGWPVILTIRL